MACGKRMRRNIEKHHVAAFESMDNFTLYAELDAQENNGGMTLPQYTYLQQMHDQFPNATWILNLRDPRKWLSSVDRWLDLRERFVKYPGGPDFPSKTGTDDADMIRFYILQAQKVRDFVAEHPSHTLVEVKIDSPDAGQIMEDAFGISEACWGNKNVNAGDAKWKFT